MTTTLTVHAAVEGIVDEAVVQKLIIGAGACPGTIYGKIGKAFLRQKVQGFNNAARTWPWLILTDLDNDADCAPTLCAQWIPDPAPLMCLRIAVREVEAWLMADVESLAEYLRVARSKIPDNPEQLVDPKREMVNIARHSRRTAIQKDMVPREGAGRSVGPAYASRMIEYIQTSWRPNVASEQAESLMRAISCIRQMVATVS